MDFFQMLSESVDLKYKYFVNIGFFFLKNEGMWLNNVWFSKTDDFHKAVWF